MTTFDSNVTRATTGGQSGAIRDYTSDVSQTRSFAVEAAWLRDRAHLVDEDTRNLHHELQASDLAERAAYKGRMGVPRLLTELGDERGMSWSAIAELLDVSVSAIRKWRKGGDASPENRSKLAYLAALLDLLAELTIEDPAQWLEVPLPLPAGYNIRPFDLYREAKTTALLDIATQRITIEQALDNADLNWRDRRSDFEVYDAPDDKKSIRIRQNS